MSSLKSVQAVERQVAILRNSLSCLTDLSPQNMLIISNMLVKFMMRLRTIVDDDDFLGESVKKERKRVLNVGAVVKVAPWRP